MDTASGIFRNSTRVKYYHSTICQWQQIHGEDFSFIRFARNAACICTREQSIRVNSGGGEREEGEIIRKSNFQLRFYTARFYFPKSFSLRPTWNRFSATYSCVILRKLPLFDLSTTEIIIPQTLHDMTEKKTGKSYTENI